MPAADRCKPYVAARAAAAFNAHGLHDEARALVEEALAAEWDDRVVRAYRDAAGAGRLAGAAGPDRTLRAMAAHSVRTTPNWR